MGLKKKTQKEMDRPLDPWYKQVRGSPGPLGKNKNLEKKCKRRWIGHWTLGINRLEAYLDLWDRTKTLRKNAKGDG